MKKALLYVSLFMPPKINTCQDVSQTVWKLNAVVCQIVYETDEYPEQHQHRAKNQNK